MSLALIAMGDSSVSVASDGALIRFENGAPARVRDDYKKFREVYPGVVIVPMGTAWLSDRLYPEVESHLRERGGKLSTFQALVDLLATRLPVWHSESELLHGPIPLDALRASVAIAGIDHQTGRSRLVLFSGKGEHPYVPIEGSTVVAIGWISDEYPQMVKAYERGVDGHAWADVMATIILEKSRESEFISNHVYTETITWCPSAEDSSATVLSRKEAEYTTAPVQ